MYKHIRRFALALLKVPAEPHAPIGNPASLRVFNAGKNYLRLRLAGWTITQCFALIGLLFWTAFLVRVSHAVRDQQQARANAPQTAAAPADEDLETRVKETLREIAKDGSKASRNRHRNKSWGDFERGFINVALLLPHGAFILLWLLKIFSILFYFVQLPLTYAVRRLDYEMRWYLVTDRSLRLRHGVWKVSESTMSFANIQQVVVSQGPVQRLLGLADVKVKSAGGGGSADQHGQHKTDDMHSGLFHCVTNAEEIRNLILERLRLFREAGLGDPDEKPTHPPSPTSPVVHATAIAAARELASEARALRAALTI
jgi:membrane protein YdbS with pleckstrin-like domain